MIKSVAFIVYPVKDIARARKFYEDTLGLKLTQNFQDDWLEYDVGDTTFAITSMDITHVAGAKDAVVAFEMDDLDQSVNRLKQLSVPFVLDTYTTPVCRLAVVSDPDGNEIIIHKRDR